jgi:hypothetical protein
MEKSIDETILETTILEKPIQDRLRQASHITVESALRNKVNLNISWYNIHGEQQSQKYTIAAGTMIEF